MSTRTVPPGPGVLRPYSLPGVSRTKLTNGLTVLHAAQASTGLVSVLVVTDAGTIREPAAQAGLASFTAQSLDEGAAGRSGEEIAWELERLGVERETEASWDASWISATIQTQLLDPAIAVLADIVQTPTFPEHEMDRVRAEQLAVILQRRKEPRALANDQILHFLDRKSVV